MNQNGLLEQAMHEVENAVEWRPGWGKARIESMMTDRPDWCISRQRTWGVPIALFVHKDSSALHPRTAELIEQVALKGYRHAGCLVRLRCNTYLGMPAARRADLPGGYVSGGF